LLGLDLLSSDLIFYSANIIPLALTRYPHGRPNDWISTATTVWTCWCDYGRVVFHSCRV